MDDLQKEKFWRSLLAYIKAGAVVPVIGPELVTVREGDQDVPLYRWLAQRLATSFELPTAELPGDFDLNDVASMHLRRGGHREDLYLQLDEMLRETALTPSEPLAALAGIPGFNLFVSLTFDSLLADAINAARPNGQRAEQIAYSPNDVHDLPCPKAKLRQPVVFHLLGQATVLPNYVVCDEDLLEFVYGLQDKQRQPKNLFEALHDSHLLILGCSFGDWLARFFLRTARSAELSQNRRYWDVLVGDPQDARLSLFLESFSPDARVIHLPAPQFVAELATRWQAAYPAAVPAADSAVCEVPTGAVFVSYASEDLEAASRLAESLRSEGLEVWFDKREIKWGDDWSRRIRGGIKDCALFLPVISRQALSDPRSYYWREWNDAADLTREMAPDEVFIVPVTIDDTRLVSASSLPDAFKKAQGEILPNGIVTRDAAERLRKIVSNLQDRQRALRA
ncbi:MAG: toll/interleukin-1 receptor domain-containing protein [Thermoanaerobaculia bacterium]